MNNIKKVITDDELFAIGNRIAVCREAKGLRSNEMADLLSVTPLYYSRIETGAQLASIMVYMAISEILGISLSYIFYGDIQSNYLKQVEMMIEDCEDSEIKMALEVMALILGK